ncbi:MAG TPA: hypothetical protein VGT07_10275 [Steroidobacteraceae bacterium]|nr:hypothetical protein [Steroidobacteraceae bacterium]
MQTSTHAARRDVLNAALAAGPHTELVVELAGRFELDLRIGEAEVESELDALCAQRDRPLLIGNNEPQDAELLAQVVAAGPYSPPVDALVRAFAADVAETLVETACELERLGRTAAPAERMALEAP